MKTRRYFVMGFGLGGNHGDGIDANGTVFSSSWYLKPHELQAYIDNGHYPANQMEGCIVIDKTAAVEANMALAYDAPMVGVKLAGEEVNRMEDILQNDTSRLVVSAIAEHNATIATLTAKSVVDKTFVGMDKVSPVAYAAWWRANGAAIGHVKNGKVIWET